MLRTPPLIPGAPPEDAEADTVVEAPGTVNRPYVTYGIEADDSSPPIGPTDNRPEVWEVVDPAATVVNTYSDLRSAALAIAAYNRAFAETQARARGGGNVPAPPALTVAASESTHVSEFVDFFRAVLFVAVKIGPGLFPSPTLAPSPLLAPSAPPIVITENAMVTLPGPARNLAVGDSSALSDQGRALLTYALIPSTPILDHFTRTAESPLSNGSLWNTTNAPRGAALLGKTDGTHALGSDTSGNAPSGSLWNTLFAAPAEVFTQFAQPASTICTLSLYWLSDATGASTGYGLIVGSQSNMGWSIVRFDAETTITLATGALPTVAGSYFALTVANGLLSAWSRPAAGAWSLLGQVNDSTYTSPRYIGWSLGPGAAGTALIDDFGGGVSQIAPIAAELVTITESTSAGSVSYALKASESTSMSELVTAGGLGALSARASESTAVSEQTAVSKVNLRVSDQSTVTDSVAAGVFFVKGLSLTQPYVISATAMTIRVVDASVVSEQATVGINAGTSNSFDGGSNGSAITVGNSGGGSGTPFDLVSSLSGQTLAYDSTHSRSGANSMKVASGGTVGQVYAGWTTRIGSQTTIWLRAYCYFTTFSGWPNQPYIARIYHGGAVVAGSACGGILVNSNGSFTLMNSTNSQIAGTTGGNTYLTGQWIRVEAKLTLSSSAAAGSCTLSLYQTNPTGLVPDEVLSNSGTVNMSGAGDTFVFGQLTTQANVGPYWLDDVAVSAVAAIGP